MSDQLSNENPADSFSSTNPEILENYTLLENLGVLKEINRLKSLLIERNELLGEAAVLCSQTEIPEIARTCAGFLVNRFIPRQLTFIYSLDESAEVRVLSFQNMHESAPDIRLIDLDPFDAFFSQNQGLTHFKNLKDGLGDEVALMDLEPMEPELVIPVKGHSLLYGLVVISPKLMGDEYTIKELAYVDRLMGFASIAIQNSIHYNSSVTDSKTRLFNTSFIQSEIDEQIGRVRRYGGAFSIVMIDLDHFKRLNDRYGHLAGDVILKNIAKIIADSIREGDVAARFGGEEFMIMLHAAGGCEAYTIAERLRKKIEDHTCSFNGETLNVTASLGCAAFTGEKELTREELVHLADSALYRSKKNGRNCTSLAGSGLLERAKKYEP